ncbi:MAG: AAA family ATPase, partial [Planococcaceae bacterium]|nr:AAA family ATPase [Planococcaceae bacterium]
MLKELSIKNFAIIEEVSVSFTDGLTVLTGETGAGKSIIIDAVHLLAGGRGSQEFIRHGAKKAELEGLFFIQDEKHPVFNKLIEFGIEPDEDTIILRRDINDHGKSV